MTNCIFSQLRIVFGSTDILKSIFTNVTQMLKQLLQQCYCKPLHCTPMGRNLNLHIYGGYICVARCICYLRGFYKRSESSEGLSKQQAHSKKAWTFFILCTSAAPWSTICADHRAVRETWWSFAWNIQVHDNSFERADSMEQELGVEWTTNHFVTEMCIALYLSGAFGISGQDS